MTRWKKIDSITTRQCILVIERLLCHILACGRNSSATIDQCHSMVRQSSPSRRFWKESGI